MLKYVVLIITVLTNLTAFSQVSTAHSSKTSDTVICLPKAVAREVVKDLFRKDSLEAELDIQNKKLGLSEQSSKLKDSVIANKDAIISLYSQKDAEWENVVILKDKQLNEYIDLSKKLEASINKINRMHSFFKGTTAILLILTISLLFVK